MTIDGHARTIERIGTQTVEPRDLVSLRRESTEIFKSAVPHFWTPCWFSMDPASLLITSHYHEGLPEFPPSWLAEEYYGNGVHKLVEAVRRGLLVGEAADPETSDAPAG